MATRTKSWKPRRRFQKGKGQIPFNGELLRLWNVESLRQKTEVVILAFEMGFRAAQIGKNFQIEKKRIERCFK